MLDMIARSIDIDFNMLFPRLGPRSDKDILLRKPDRFAGDVRSPEGVTPPSPLKPGVRRRLCGTLYILRTYAFDYYNINIY